MELLLFSNKRLCNVPFGIQVYINLYKQQEGMLKKKYNRWKLSYAARFPGDAAPDPDPPWPPDWLSDP